MFKNLSFLHNQRVLIFLIINKWQKKAYIIHTISISKNLQNVSGKADSLIACYQENIWEGLIVGYKSKLIKQQNISGKGDLAYISTTLKFRNTQSNLNPYLSNLDQTASQGKTYRIKTFFQNSEKYRLSHWQTLSMKPRIHLV